ncbi:hypothetical protein GCM10009116_19880 [Brevundimonas basaltis]
MAEAAAESPATLAEFTRTRSIPILTTRGRVPCDDPETAREWNADAAAAEALRRMIAAALAQDDPTHHLANREYGAMICERADGVLTISPVVWGDPIFDAGGTWVNPGEQPTVPVDIDACGIGSTPLAMIHTHPSTGGAGAIPSWNDAQWVAAINARRGDNHGRIYVVAIDGTSFRIEVYDQSNAGAWETGERGPEVNPNAQPCTLDAVQ